MFSVDNFYLILEKNLFEPINLPAWYCYPFGSTVLKPVGLRWLNYNLEQEYSDRLQLLLWDQEPFDFQLYRAAIQERCRADQINLRPNAVAVSDICKESKIVPYNWYYFFHGFAALDWFRDAQYLPLLNNNFSYVFISLNRLVTKERSYRLSLIADLHEKELLKYGAVSININDSWISEVNDPNTKLTRSQINQVSNIFTKRGYNLVLDTDQVPGWASASLGQFEVKLFQDSFLHLVTETIFYSNKLHLTEKTFRPIAMCRPFVLAGAAYNLKYLKSYGFQTFDQWWDESYDQETDPEQRLIKINKIVEQLCKLKIEDLKEMYNEMIPVLKYNQEHFYNGFKKIIVNELADNYINLLLAYNEKNKNAYDINDIDIKSFKNILLR